MASLIETSALERLLPHKSGTATLTEVRPGQVTSVMPFAGQQAAVAAGLAALGLDWPPPNRAVVAGAASILWTGRGQAFLVGAPPERLAPAAALTDQSDGWAVMRLEGTGAEAVLARLVPLDLRAAVFAPGQVARSGLNHMMMILHRSAANAFEIWVFRSMAETAVRELSEAMARVAARG